MTGSRRGRRMIAVLSVIGVVVAAGIALAQAWPGAWWWIAPVAAASGVLTERGIAALSQIQQRRVDESSVVRRNTRGAGAALDGRFPVVGQVGLEPLGVHRSIVDVPFIRRKAYDEVVARLGEGNPVLLVGPSMVGKTRLAAAVIKDRFPELPIVIPNSASAINEIESAELELTNHVIWLDDVDRFVAGGALSASTVERLAVENVVIATMRAKEYERFAPTNDLKPPEWEVLSLFRTVVLRRELTTSEEDDLTTKVSNSVELESIRRVGIGEYVGAAEQIVNKLEMGAAANPLGYALVAGIADWRRAGLRRATPRNLLRTLAAPYLTTPKLSAQLARGNGLEDALAWACQEINPTVSLLEQNDDDTYTISDFALDYIMELPPQMPVSTWELVLRAAGSDEFFAVGGCAFVEGAVDIAERAWLSSVEAGNRAAMSGLGQLFAQRDPDRAEEWFQRAVSAGDWSAMTRLGHLYLPHSRDRAEDCFRRAADAGETGGMIALGTMVVQTDPARAESWYRRAIDADDPAAMTALGMLLERTDPRQSEEWITRAVELGDGRAMTYLGMRAHREGDLSGAIDWFVRGLTAGDSLALIKLALSIASFEPHRAEYLCLRAVNAGQRGAACALGTLLIDRGRLDDAESILRMAFDAGDQDAISLLGMLHLRRGDLSEANRWLQRAADAGDARACTLMGAVAGTEGRNDEAEDWYLRGIAAGDPSAFSSLGQLTAARDDFDKAEDLFRHALAAGDLGATVFIGLMCEARDDVDQAEYWYRYAIDAGQRPAMVYLANLIANSDPAEAEQWRLLAEENGTTSALNHFRDLNRANEDQ